MSSSQQTPKQPSTQFKIGDEVRCVDPTGTPLEKNIVYKVIDLDGLGKTLLYLEGLQVSFASYRFVHAVSLRDGCGIRWLVVNERLPKKGEWLVDDSNNRHFPTIITAGHDYTNIICKIVIPLVEFSKSAEETDAIGKMLEVVAERDRLKEQNQQLGKSVEQAEGQVNYLRQQVEENRALAEKWEKQAKYLEDLYKEECKRPRTVEEISKSILAHYPKAEAIEVIALADGEIGFSQTTYEELESRHS